MNVEGSLTLTENGVGFFRVVPRDHQATVVVPETGVATLQDLNYTITPVRIPVSSLSFLVLPIAPSISATLTSSIPAG